MNSGKDFNESSRKAATDVGDMPVDMPVDMHGIWLALLHLSTYTYGTVESVIIVDATQTMYDLTVEDVHTFAVGDGDWVVHNQNGLPNYTDVNLETLLAYTINNMNPNGNNSNNILLAQFNPHSLDSAPFYNYVGDPRRDPSIFNPGFSGAYDPTSSNFILIPNGETRTADAFDNIPFQTLNTAGGHGGAGNVLTKITNNSRQQMFGFTAGYVQVNDGNPFLALRYSSRQINANNRSFPGRVVPPAQQIIITNTLNAAVNCGVQNG